MRVGTRTRPCGRNSRRPRWRGRGRRRRRRPARSGRSRRHRFGASCRASCPCSRPRPRRMPHPPPRPCRRRGCGVRARRAFPRPVRTSPRGQSRDRVRSHRRLRPSTRRRPCRPRPVRGHRRGVRQGGGRPSCAPANAGSAGSRIFFAESPGEDGCRSILPSGEERPDVFEPSAQPGLTTLLGARCCIQAVTPTSSARGSTESRIGSIGRRRRCRPRSPRPIRRSVGAVRRR